MTPTALDVATVEERFSSDSRRVLADPKGVLLSRAIMVFRLGGRQALDDLLHEFSLDPDVVVTVDDISDRPVISVETSGVAAAIWDVRATIGMFDDGAVELDGQR